MKKQWERLVRWMRRTKLSVENTQLQTENDRLWRLVENLSQALNKK